MRLFLVFIATFSYLFSIDFNAIDSLKNTKTKNITKVSLSKNALSSAQTKANNHQIENTGFSKSVTKFVKEVAKSSGGSVSNVNNCSGNEQCYTIVGKSSSTWGTPVKCRNGATNNIYYDKSSGKYYESGALVRHYGNSFREVANKSCGVY